MTYRSFAIAIAAALLVAAATRGTLSVHAQAATAGTTGATAYNVRIATDASPDLTDIDSFIQSTTSRWATSEEKVWALYYWSHILRRQTSPIVLHGFEVTDPIRNFNDYGFTMCSTVSGINQTLFEMLGLQHQYWDICNHTVSQVFYNNAFHMIDSSMSNLVTQDDGVTLASLQEAAADGARLAKERSLYSTSPNGFLTGSDTMRPLPDATNPVNGSTLAGFADAYCEDGLKLRDYYYNWSVGHRYVLNVRENESYTRYYSRLGTGTSYYVSSEDVAVPDPSRTFENDSANRFNVRGNGQWTFTPSLAGGWANAAYSSANITESPAGLTASDPSRIGDLIYKVQAANAITSQQIALQFAHGDAAATATVSLSINDGQTWQPIGALDATTGTVPLAISLRDQVNGFYETLIRIQMTGGSPQGVALSGLTITTITQVNTKALPRLNIGRNEVYVGAGDQTDTTVLWPDLRGDFWQKDAFDSSNIASQSTTVPRKYTAVVYPSNLSRDAYLAYRLTAPSDFTSVTYGGRLHNYSAGSYIEFLHSFDGGTTWIAAYRLTDTSKPWDDIHYETVAVPPGVRTVLFKFLIHNTNPDSYRASGLYNVRMEGHYLPQVQAIPPLDVTLRWKEIRADRTTVARSHQQRVTTYPFKYIVDVGGSDHPIMESMTVSLAGADSGAPGYSDGVDAGGAKYVYRRQTVGTNFAVGRPFTISRAPSGFQSSAGASNTTILTDGIVGSPVTGSFSYWWGQCWTSGADVDLRVDLGAARNAGAFRAHLFGYPGWDALAGEVQDKVEVLTSVDGVTYTSRGFLNTSLWKKDVPINYMLQDDERSSGWNFELVLPSPVAVRYVRYHVTPKRNLCVSELQVLDSITYTPFDIRVALPDAYGQPDPGDPTDQPPSVAIIRPTAGQSFTSPASISIEASASDSDGTIARVEFLVDGTLAETDTSSPYSASWTTSTPGTYSLTARAVDDAGNATVSAPISVTVEAGTIPPGPGPDVVLWAAEAPLASNWTVTPDASAAGGNRLQNPNKGAAKVVTALASPGDYFETTFTANAGVPYHIWIRGKALSNSTSNDSVHVQFDGSLDQSGQAAYRIGTTRSIEYVLEECSGCGLSNWGWQDNGWGARGLLGPPLYFATTGPQRIRVQSREDGLAIDQIVISSSRWVNTPPGPAKNDVTILAKTDSPGGGNRPPAITITSPASGANVTAPATVSIGADASDSDGTITKVDFFANDTVLGTDDAPPWTVAWTAATPGSYTLTAKATDNSGATTTSAPVSVTVSSAAANTDDIVLHAADAAIAVNWSVVNDSTAAGGKRLQNPNAGAAKIVTASATPGSYFEMTFNAVANRPYRLWIRGKAASNSYANDSVFVQFDASVDADLQPTYRIATTSATEYNLEECSGCGISGWGWQDNGWGSPGFPGPVIYFDHDGVQTIRIQVREDGLGIDQIVLSSVKWITSAPGPATNDTTILPR
jgi:hypothetical protein